MKKAIKNKNKRVRAWCLGDDSPVERELIASGRIKLHADGRYEIFSLESVNGQGEIARKGDYFKVDTSGYPYPNKKDWFEVHHQLIDGDEYEQLAEPVSVWQVGDDMCPEMQYLLDEKLITINTDDEQHYFHAFLWGAPLSAAIDAAIVIYSSECDASGEFIHVDFNFVAGDEFRKTYTLLDE